MGLTQWQVVPRHIQEVAVTVFANAQLPGVAGEMLMMEDVGLFNLKFLPSNKSVSR